jgi:hypothetical protein
MNTAHHLSVDEACHLALTAAAADLEYWAWSVAVDRRIDLDDLVDVLDALRAASAPHASTPALSTLAAS